MRSDPSRPGVTSPFGRRLTAIAFAVAFSLASSARVGAPAAAAAPATPVTQDQGLALGRAVGRAIVSFQSAGMCAIPFFIARCRSDFDAFAGGDDAAFANVPGLGPTPLERMRSFYATGDPAKFPTGFATIRTATAPDALWKARPAVAWAMDEGIVDELVGASLHGESAIYAAPAASQMLRRVHDAGSEANVLGGDFATADGHFQASALVHLAHAIDVRHPAAALPQLPSIIGDRGDVELGLGYATVFQLCDAPGIAGLPESQAFLDRFFADAARYSTVPAAASRLGKIRDELRFADGYDAARLAKAIKDLIAFQNALPGPALRRTLVGQFASQIGYNASVQRDPGFLPAVARHVTLWNDADRAFPGLIKRRVALGLIDATDFAAQRKASLDLVAFLVADEPAK